MTDRYVLAVLPGVPAKSRPVVEAQLRESIGESVAQRILDGQASEDAERAALTELGDPLRVSAAYSGRELHLIGPAVYPSYIRLLRLLLVIVVPIVGVVVGAASAIGGASTGQIVTAGLGTAFTVGVQVAFWVTVAFALVDRYGSRAHADASDWGVDDLPEPPDYRISLGSTIGSIIGLALLIWVLLWNPGYQESFDLGGPSIPVLNPALDTFWMPLLVIVLLASIALESAKYLKGRWTVPLAAVNTVLSLAFVIPVVWLASTDRLVNPEFLVAITVDPVASVVSGLPSLIAWIIVAVSVVDIADGWRKALRSRVRRPAIAAGFQSSRGNS